MDKSMDTKLNASVDKTTNKILDKNTDNNADKTASKVEKGAMVDLMQISMEELISLKNTTEDDYRNLTSSYDKMKEHLTDFTISCDCVQKLKTVKQDQEVIIPCNEMMNVYGNLTNIGKVTVDIGTGYFAEMTIDEALNHLNRQIELIKEKLSQTNDALLQRQQLIPILNDAIKHRTQEATKSRA